MAALNPGIKIIALSDGHGMQTSGKRTPIFSDGTKSSETGKNFMHENEFNRAVVKYLGQHLTSAGFKVVYLAPTDADTSLSARVALAEKANADLYLSVHANANIGNWGSWGGIETFVYPGGMSEKIGTILHKHIMGGTEFRNRGVKNGSHLYEIRKPSMPSVLFELGFMDNLEEAKLLLSDAYRRECAREIYEGLCEVTGKKPAVSKAGEPDKKAKEDKKVALNFSSEHLRIIAKLEAQGVIPKGYKPKTGEQMETLSFLHGTLAAVSDMLQGPESSPSAWAKDDVKYIVDKGITDGTRPTGYPTRQEAMAMISRAVQYIEKKK